MLSQSRFNALHANLSSVARKVYDAVPIQEEWSVQQITMEIHRTRTSVRVDLLAGCLDTLRRAGLICEPRRGYFRRERVREAKAALPHEDKSNQQEDTNTMAHKPQPAPTAPASPLDRLGDLAQRVTKLATALKDVAAEISDAAIDIQAQLEHGEEDVKKLRQLQLLLKSIGE